MARQQTLFEGDFGSAIRGRMRSLTQAKAWTRHGKKLKRLLHPPPASAREVSHHALAFFDLFDERHEQVIGPWLAGQLRREVEAANKLLGDDEKLVLTQLSLRRISLPAKDQPRWELTLESDDEKLVFVSFDGWRLRGVQFGD